MPQICPILSMATLEAPKPGALLVGGKAPEPQFAHCIGPSCAFFCALRNEKGEIVDGSCAAVLLPRAVLMLQQTMHEATTASPEDAENPDTH